MVGVPRPVNYDVRVPQYEYVPVEEPCDPCCCGNDNLGIDKIVNSTNVNFYKGGSLVRNPALAQGGNADF